MIIFATMKSSIQIKNKKASFLYEFIDRYTAGIRLTGTEIKSIRNGQANLNDAYCFFRDHELFIRGMHIREYEMGNIYNHDPNRDRKLLLNRRELMKLEKGTAEKGFTIVPVKLFLNDRGLAKLDIALARGKKQYDRRESLKEKDARREMDRLRKF